MTPFEILNVSTDAGDTEIKQAYLQKIRDYPPEHAPKQFQRIRSAFEKIENQQKRLEYELFTTYEPSVSELIGHLLQQRGKVQRPNKAVFCQALLASIQAKQIQS